MKDDRSTKKTAVGNRCPTKTEDAPMAKEPSISRSQLANPTEIPGNKVVPSDLPGAEEENNIGTVARGATAGTKGASSSSEGRKGNPDHYGSNQAGLGLATGPMTTNAEVGTKKRRKYMVAGRRSAHAGPA